MSIKFLVHILISAQYGIIKKKQSINNPRKQKFKSKPKILKQGIDALHCRQPERDAHKTYVNTL